MIELSVVNDGSSDIGVANPTVIKIIGCGGGGSNAVNCMVSSGVKDVEFVALNTDLQALNVSKAQKRIVIGRKITDGLGAGGNPEVGENAAKEDTESITNIVQGTDMVIITAGMGGGTGTGSAPVVADIARKSGALTIAVVTTPFDFEGPVRMKNAQEGLKKLRENVDSLIIVPNQQIMKISNKKLNFRQAFRLADDVLCQGVQGISELITTSGVVNLDFADVKSVMKGQGNAILGVGVGEGENRALDAAQGAISNPMLENCQIDGASNILVNITCDNDSIGMDEVQEIVNTIKASAAKNVNVIFGVVDRPDMGDKISVTVIATGFERAADDDDDDDDDSVRRGEENSISWGDFENVVNGRLSSSVEKAAPEPVQKVSLPGFGGRTLAHDAAPARKDAGEPKAPAAALSSAIEPEQAPAAALPRSRGIRPPEGFVRRKDDLSQPAVWRNPETLPRSINLSDDR